MEGEKLRRDRIHGGRESMEGEKQWRWKERS